MPKLWSQTIEAHRRDVREAILDAAATLVGEHGLLSVSMSQIAEKAGIGRATLYKYFTDVEAILRAWHERQIARHLAELAAIRDATGDHATRLAAVLEGYALRSNAHGHDDVELAAFFHRDDQVADARRELQGMVASLIADGAAAGDLRDDVPADELASYCLHALTAAAGVRSPAAIRRLVSVTLDGLRRS